MLLLGSLSSIAYSGQGIDTLKIDSTRILGAPVYVWNQVFQDLASYDEAKLYIMQLQVEVKKAKVLQAKSDTALIASQKKTAIAEEKAKVWEERYDIKDKQNEQTHKDKRRYKRERNAAIVLNVLLTVALVL